MSREDDFRNWMRRRGRYPFFGGFFEDIDEIMREIDEMMHREFKDFTKRVPKELVREKKLPDGSTTREWGPFVYGYSVKIGPDGKPQIREFGNVKPFMRQTRFGARKPIISFTEEREPLIDVMPTNGEFKVIAELPGVEKSDIMLTGTEDTLTISVDNPQRKFHKEIQLPEKVDPKTARSSYKNGVLEVNLKKVVDRKKTEGEHITID